MKFKKENQDNKNFFSFRKNQHECERFFLIILALFSQHIVLFQDDFTEFNFRLIFYITFLSLITLLKKIQSYIFFTKQHKDFGLILFLGFTWKFIFLMIIYYLFNMFEEYSKVKIIILIYYFIQKVITWSFREKRPFLSIRKDFNTNYFKSKIRRTRYCCFWMYLFDFFFTTF